MSDPDSIQKAFPHPIESFDISPGAEWGRGGSGKEKMY